MSRLPSYPVRHAATWRWASARAHATTTSRSGPASRALLGTPARAAAKCRALVPGPAGSADAGVVCSCLDAIGYSRLPATFREPTTGAWAIVAPEGGELARAPRRPDVVDDRGVLLRGQAHPAAQRALEGEPAGVRLPQLGELREVVAARRWLRPLGVFLDQVGERAQRSHPREVHRPPIEVDSVVDLPVLRVTRDAVREGDRSDGAIVRLVGDGEVGFPSRAVRLDHNGRIELTTIIADDDARPGRFHTQRHHVAPSRAVDVHVERFAHSFKRSTFFRTCRPCSFPTVPHRRLNSRPRDPDSRYELRRWSRHRASAAAARRRRPTHSRRTACTRRRRPCAGWWRRTIHGHGPRQS